MENFKKKWGIESNFQFTIILLVFAITGSSSVKFANLSIDFIGISPDKVYWLLYWPLNILITFGLYQVLLLIFGTLFGQFKFFWEFEKKMLSRFGIKFEDKN